MDAGICNALILAVFINISHHRDLVIEIPVEPFNFMLNYKLLMGQGKQMESTDSRCTMNYEGSAIFTERFMGGNKKILFP